MEFSICNMKKQQYIKKRRSLSAKLIEAREKAELTQKQVAETGIITQSELSKLENSSRRVDFLLLIDLAELYNQPVTFFIPSVK
ncbi:helix-turn-helix transcriptional regulator [Dysgonomonas sp. GY75]|uniref:helix-turn-helix domain-containing protein n=1 Tax=Dysgonomonas sp. GY75 TaxID=2780419 RepID=UPI001A0755C8|nr:helix-turn-helix transcriptional regulator [Dysgonomonas sp. GY75]MBF0651337.1 helix-turn-helix transcriptional regulator [Dysgonomonas sp. GY75]